MRCFFGSPFPFFFFFQRIFFFKISLHIFFQTCRYYHLFIMYILVLQHRWKSQEKTGRAFLNNNEQSEIPRRFFALFFFLGFPNAIMGVGAKGIIFWRLASKDGKYTHTLHTKPVFSFLSSVLPSSFVGGESYLQRHPILIT
ncbi:LOW QUALITY PROTEIN: uncharacterized protein QC764_702300 [Podospora pseudoanserina]|uniref:Uncharacterized protein n=1 Tax=Podospora pseudoanserina TaxID=2609844 RepID=A0ABR0HJ07_9PEZI|nr:LOW QUALITY PROTEIN: hypothetical protein QC764_702300 [Podospora pseudoanserina]